MIRLIDRAGSEFHSGTPYLIADRESLYLDLLRALAAFTVLLDHASAVFDFAWFGGVGHHAVIVFFVLSGYVISNVAETRERVARVFIVSRLARLWSVLVPAMALTVACDFIGRQFGHLPDAYAYSPIDHPLIRIGSALTFLSECWVSIQPLSNFAVWSLGLEFWYYMIFAAWVFLPPGRKRIIAIGAALCLSGFKGLLLMPIWLMGVALQKMRGLQRLKPTIGSILWAGGALMIYWLTLSGIYGSLKPATSEILGPWLMQQLAEARMFWFDWITGSALMLHLAGARTVTKWIALERFECPIRWCAGVSFAAYLFHMPLLHMLAAFLPRNQAPLAIAVTLGVIAALGPLAERTKLWWRLRLNWLLSRVPVSVFA